MLLKRNNSSLEGSNTICTGDFQITMAPLKKKGEKSTYFSARVLLCRSLLFEKAYCEYRLNRTTEATKTLNSAPEMDSRMKELYAQVVSVNSGTNWEDN